MLKVRPFLLLILCFSVLLNAYANVNTFALFTEQNGSNASITHGKAVSINRSIKAAKIGQKITVDLLNGESLILTVTTKDRKANGTVVINATNSEQTSMILTIGKRQTFGSIDGPDFSYSLGFSPESGPLLMDNRNTDASRVRLENDMRFPPRTSNKPRLSEQQQAEKSKNKESNDIQDSKPDSHELVNPPADMTMLVVYSPEFAAGFGNDPESRIEQAIAFTNVALTSTGIDAQFRLVGTQEIDFNNSLTAGTLLNQATFATGAFTSLPDLRNQFGADMVSVLAYRSDFAPDSDFAANGVAWVNGDNPNFGFSVTRLSLFCCDSVFAHELGHNLGSGHERTSVSGNAPGSCSGGFTGFSCGHGVSGNFDTIMSRNVGTSINRFSNPSQRCNGLPCGIAQNQANAADNFTSFNISGFLVEQFRDNVTSPSPSDAVVPPFLFLLLDDD